MPNFLTHLAVAKRYTEKHNMKGEQTREFYRGSVYPDLEIFYDGKSKKEAHYNRSLPTLTSHEMTVENFYRNRFDFKKFLETNKVETPFEKGVLLHLIVDNECYPAVLDMQRFYDLVQRGVRPRFIVTATFNSLNDYLQKKYEVDFAMTGMEEEIQACLLKWKKKNGEMPYHNLLDTPDKIEKLDMFIENISCIDLADFIEKNI